VSKPFTGIDGEALEALIARVSEAKEHQLTLTSEDCQLLLDAIPKRLSNAFFSGR
jgi:hypothetical protein